MNRLNLLMQLQRYFGMRWLIFRVLYVVKLRSGWFHRRFPSYQWNERPLGSWLRSDVPSSHIDYVAWRNKRQPQFFFDELPPTEALNISEISINEADALLEGEWTYFAHLRFDMGMPPAWHRNPFTGQDIPASRHWSTISDFDDGDIKFVWEASRFSFVFTLVRAYAATGNAEYGAAFWRLVSDWANNNPPHIGPNWKCGQEASFRVMAWCFGLYAFRVLATADQFAQLVTMIAAHGERIEANIDYARSQNNNHGISEAVGLWTIGMLFPELKRSEEWVNTGKGIFEAEVKRQVYDDGSYAQYSLNYQRVMLHDVIWALRLGELNYHRFPDAIYDCVRKSVDFLLGLLDHTSGNVPNLGSNDSALVLPLNELDPNDFRPLIQSAHYLVQRKRIFDGFNDDIVWLFGVEAANSPLTTGTPEVEANLAAPIGGYYTLREKSSWMMMRCADYRARPHHADQLHIDFWWRGINILCDAGTYLYNGEPPWRNSLSRTAVHNTVAVDGRDQMTAFSRFLWLDWSRGVVHHHDSSYWEGSHNGYERLKEPVKHRRAVQRIGELWVIVDELSSQGKHDYSLHWLIPEMAFDVNSNRIALHTAQGLYYVYFSTSQFGYSRGRENSNLGWRSLSYGSLEPALSFSLISKGGPLQRFWTILSPFEVDINSSDDAHLKVNGIELAFGDTRLIEVRTG